MSNNNAALKTKVEQETKIASEDDLIRVRTTDDVELTEQELNRVSGGRSKQSEAKANLKAQSY
jgi:hypothetical protein